MVARCLLRIENTDTSREVAEAVDQIQDSLRWVGIDWDGPVSFQLDTAERARELAQELVAGGQRVRGRRSDPLPPAEGGDGRRGLTPSAARSSSGTSFCPTS